MPIADLNDPVLKECDVEIIWDSEPFLRIMQFASKIGYNNVPFRFYKDRISILQIVDDVVISDVEIYAREALLKYNPGELTDGGYKLAIVDLSKDVLNDYKRFYSKAGITSIKIDTKYGNRIEFILQNVKVWTEIETYQSQKELKNLDRIPDDIRRVRADKNIPFASIVLVNRDFKLMCKTSKRDSNKLLRFTVDNENRLEIITSGNKKKGRSIDIIVAEDPNAKKDLKQVYFDIDNMNVLKSLRDFMLNYNREVDTKQHKGKLGYAKSITTKTRQSVIVDMNYLSLFNIESVGDTTMEIRENKPILLEHSLFFGIHMLMVVGQREEDSG